MGWFPWNSISFKHEFAVFECSSNVPLLSRLCRIEFYTIFINCLHYTVMKTIPLWKPVQYNANIVVNVRRASKYTSDTISNVFKVIASSLLTFERHSRWINYFLLLTLRMHLPAGSPILAVLTANLKTNI